MGGSSSKPRVFPKVAAIVQARTIPRPPTAEEIQRARNAKKNELVASLRSRRDTAVKNIVDSLRGKRLTGNYAPLLSFDGKDYWLYLDIGSVPPNVLLSAAPTFAAAAAPARPAPLQRSPIVKQDITTYEHINFKGKSRTFGIGRYPKMPPGFNNSISSMRVPRGRHVTIYSLPNYAGQKKVLNADTADFTRMRVDNFKFSSWNDKVQSMIVA